MIFNGQKNEDFAQAREHPDIEHVELQAEICFMRIASSSVLSYMRNTRAIMVQVLDSFHDPEYLLRFKNQIRIHREILPELAYQSGQYLQHHSPFEDPLIA